MKKQFLLIASVVLTLASCQSDSANNADTQAQIDSAVNARVEELRMQMMMQNDSLINAEAQRRADSMIAGMGTGATTSGSARQSTNTQRKPSSPARQETIGSGKPKMGEGNNDNTVGSGKPKMGEGDGKSNSVGSGKPKMGDK